MRKHGKNTLGKGCAPRGRRPGTPARTPVCSPTRFRDGIMRMAQPNSSRRCRECMTMCRQGAVVALASVVAMAGVAGWSIATAQQANPFFVEASRTQPTQSPQGQWLQKSVAARSVSTKLRRLPSAKAASTARTDDVVETRPRRLPRSAKTASSSDSQGSVFRQASTASLALPASAEIATPVPATRRAADTWLPSGTALSKEKEARNRLDTATEDYGVKAWASAEASAWSAVDSACEAIDRQRQVAGENRFATAALRAARDAIREAADFAGPYASNDPVVLARLIRSHRTEVIDVESGPAVLADLTTADAADRYLNEARRSLGSIASKSLIAAQAFDLLAAIHEARDDKTALAGPISLCLRRAAFQGQSDNAELAKKLGHQLALVGLYQESGFAL